MTEPQPAPSPAPAPARPRRALRDWAAVAGVLVLGLLVIRLTGCIESMAYHPFRADFVTPPGYEDVWITTEDGVRLHAWFMPARGVAPGTPAPAVLHAHGNAGNVSFHDSFSDFLTGHGFHVLLFDYRKFGRSDNTGPLRRRGLVKDTRAALDHLFERDDVDSDRVGVLGVSLGAAFALDAAASDERVRSVVTLSAFSSWQTIAGEVLPLIGPLLMPPGVDPESAAARLGDRPLLVMHADRDEIISVRHAARIADAAEAAGVPVTLWTHPQGDHNAFVQTVPEARRAMADFFHETLVVPPD
ncbi:MAG: alpha/beta fold hydrolase [Phycisphaerales bacterium]|nr:alpha/beta fold hydrolase [Planctomycetota bacterium]MCH8508996.1 alpha/beta fold hydrolase [Phycisphaerales bacterium]